MYEVTIRFNDDGSVTLVPPKAKPKVEVSPTTTPVIPMEVFKKRESSPREMPKKIRHLTRNDTLLVLRELEKVKQKFGYSDSDIARYLGYNSAIMTQWRDRTECISKKAYDTAMAFVAQRLAETSEKPVEAADAFKEHRRSEAIRLITTARKTLITDTAIQDALDLPRSTICHWKAGRTTPTEQHLTLLRNLVK